MREVVVGGVRLAFEVRGHAESPKMVMLHALGQRGSNWAGVANRFSQFFEVFTLDLRGHGSSDWPGSYSFEAMSDDVIGFMDQLALRSAVLVGHSMGGVVSYRLAMQRPDLVDRLIVEDVPPPYVRDHPVPERPLDTGSLDFDWAVVPGIVTEVNAGAPEMWAGLNTISAPTLLVGGGAESHIPHDKLQEVARRIPQCHLHTIPVGHHVHSGDPDKFANAVEDWIVGTRH